MKVIIDSANQRLQSYSGTVAEQDYLHAVITTDDGVMALVSGRGGVVGGSTTAPPTNPAPSFTVAPSATPTAATVGQPVALSLGTVANGTATGILMQGTTNRTSEISNGSWTPTIAGGWTWAVTATGAGGTTAAPVVSGTAVAAGSAPVITAQPSISPAGAQVGATLTINIGTASGSPTPTATWDITLGGTSVKSQVANNQLTAQAGNYLLSVTWSNSAGSVAAASATLTVSQASGATGLLSGTTMPSTPQAQPANLVPVPAGEFTSATGWSTHTGLIIDTAAGLAVWDGTSTTQQSFEILMTSAATAGREYGLVSSVTARTAGTVSMGFGTPSAVGANGAAINSTRTRSGRLTATGASARARLTVSPGAALSIDYLRAYDLTALMARKWRVIVLLTQSQGVGAESGQPTDSKIYVPEPRALYVPCVANAAFGSSLDGNGIGIPMIAVDPMQHQTTNAGGGPGTTFCRTFCDGLRDDEQLFYVASGYAGGGMLASGAVWNRTENGSAWAKMVATVNALRAIWPTGSSVAGMLLWQGESDRGASSAIPHATELRNCVLDRRAAWGNFPVVSMPIGGDDWNVAGSNTYQMIQAHYLLDSNSGHALSLPLCSAVQRDPSWTLRQDGTHYDQPSVEAAAVVGATRMLNLNYGISA